MSAIKQGLAPISRPDARLLILGSLPGDASLAAARYYAHPTNQFWRLLEVVSGHELAAMTYEQRIERLAELRIALWDVIASAARRGSLDQAIRSAAHNPLAECIDAHPRLEAVAFNGSTAAAIGRRLIGRRAGIELIELPSSSAANTRPFEEKAAAWRRLARFCGSLSLPGAHSASQ